MDPKRPQAFDLESFLKEETPDLELEDILREFGSQTQPTEEPVPQDTVRLEPVAAVQKQTPVSSDTVVFAPVQEQVAEPKIFEPAPQLPLVPEKEEIEPFSEDWEPEYEEPMGEFSPPEPIQFPRSRQHTLRKKLVHGPERQYFVLMEEGVGKLKWGMLLQLILLAGSALLSVLYATQKIPQPWLKPVIFGQILLAMLSVLVGCYRLMEGIGALLKGKFTLELLLLVSLLVAAVDGFFCLQSARMPHSTLLCLQMLMVQWAAFQRRDTLLRQLDSLRKANDLDALVKMEAFLEDRPGYRAVPGDPDSFMEHAGQVGGPERSLRIFGALGLAFSVVLGVATGVSYGLPTGVQACSAALLICLPVTAFITISRPAALVERRLYRHGALLCGWHGVKHAQKQAVYPVSYEDLLPEGSLKMNGVRFCGSADPGRVVSVTTALLEADGKGLVEVFRKLPRSRNHNGHRVREFASYTGGIGGLVDDQQVLVGTAEFMQEMGMELPNVGKGNFALYAALEGEISGVFVLTCQKMKSASVGLRVLCGDRNVLPVLVDCDFLLTAAFLRSRLGVNCKRLYMPAREVRQQLSGQQPGEEAQVIALMTKPTLAAKAYGLCGARVLRSCWVTGAWIHVLGGAIGLLAVAVLALIGATHLLSPINLLLYSGLWAIPGLLITQWAGYF